MTTNDASVIATNLSVEYLQEHYPLKVPDPSDPSPRITSSFIIEGADFDPEQCTAAIGLTPTRTSNDTKRLPDPMREVALEIGGAFWRVDLKDERIYDTNEGLSRLLEILWPRREQIVSFVADHILETSFLSSVSIFFDRPIYSVGCEEIKKIALLGAEYGLDIFDYRK